MLFIPQILLQLFDSHDLQFTQTSGGFSWFTWFQVTIQGVVSCKGFPARLANKGFRSTMKFFVSTS
jgi:hypothetical protein